MDYCVFTRKKMKYKADYLPAEVLCPITYRYVPLDELVMLQVNEDLPDLRLCHDQETIEDMNISNEELDDILFSLKVYQQDHPYGIFELNEQF